MGKEKYLEMNKFQI